MVKGESGSSGSGSGSGSVVVAVVAVVSVVVAVVSVVAVVAVDCVGSVGFVTSEELVVPDVAGAVVPLVTSGLPPQETSATAETRNNAASMSANTFFINFPSVPDFVFILKYTVVRRKSQCSNRGYFVLAGFYLVVSYAWALCGRVETIGLPLKNHKDTCFFSRFSLTKSAAKVI